VAKSCVTVCFTYSSQGSVVTQTHLGHGGVFKYDFVTNFLLSLTMTENFENRLKFGEVMGKSLVSCFFDPQCRYLGKYPFLGEDPDPHLVQSSCSLWCPSYHNHLNLFSHLSHNISTFHTDRWTTQSAKKNYKKWDQYAKQVVLLNIQFWLHQVQLTLTTG